ncbi:MAG: twin-arginine translocation signal domain-containing protein [Actinomycetota bacterium]|nr:twin-arginine translocation signal domain-containing protein [Actinomycetota bacterium]
MSRGISSSGQAPPTPNGEAEAPSASDPTEGLWDLSSRRSFLVGAGVGVGALGAGLMADLPLAAASTRLTKGDEAILRFLAAAEILETDLWQQYNELCGVQDSEVPGGSGNEAFTKAVNVLDADMAQYVHDNTEDEFTHFTFINAYLKARGGAEVNLGRFRSLPSSKATGAQQVKRLTNLMELTVDTTWWTRYRSPNMNPDLGGTFPPAVPGLLKGRFPAIPRSDADLKPEKHLQAIANTAGFHFATIEQGGTSLYPQLAQRVKDKEVLRVLLSIGPTETMHFQTWMDKAGNAPALKDPTNGLEFPDLNSPPFGGELFQTNLIMPEPTVFLSRKFPVCSIIRPTETHGAAMGALQFLTADGLFRGQSSAFFAFMTELAKAADAARP